MSKAIDDLNSLERKMVREGGAPADVARGWLDFSWIPSWLSAILKMSLPIVGVLLLLCCAIQVFCHCIRKTGNKALGMNYIGNMRKPIYKPGGEGQNRDDVALLKIMELPNAAPHILQVQPPTISHCQITYPQLSCITPERFALRDNVKPQRACTLPL